MPSRDLDFAQVISSLQQNISQTTELNINQDLITTIKNIRINSSETKTRNGKIEKEFIEPKISNSSKNITKKELKPKQSKKSFISSPSKKQVNDNEKTMKRLQIKKTLLDKKLLNKENNPAANTVNLISSNNTNEENNNNFSENSNLIHLDKTNNTQQLSLKNANFYINASNTNSNLNFINSNNNDLTDNPYGFSSANSEYLNSNINSNNINNNLNNKIVINSYNFINKVKNKSLNIFDNNEIQSITTPNNNNNNINNRNSCYSYFNNSSNKNNSLFSSSNFEITNNNIFNNFNSNTKLINNNTNYNNSSNANMTNNIGASHFSNPYCINIINENEISQIDSSKNNSILAETNEKEDSNKNIKTNITSKNISNNLINKNSGENFNINNFNNTTNDYYLNDKLILNKLNSRNINISNFESIEETTKKNTHSRNTLKKYQNCLSSKDSENNTLSIAVINDESTNFCNVNSKGSQFNTLDSGNNFLIINKNSGLSKNNSRTNTNSNNNVNSNSHYNKAYNNSPKRHHKSLSKGVLFNKRTSKANTNSACNINVSNSNKKSEKNFSYGILFKEFDSKLNKELKEISADKDTKHAHKSVKSNSIGKQGKEINMNFQLNKIKEDLKEKKIPKFKNQFKLNKHLIRDFKIGEVSNAKQSSKNHMLITEEYISYQENKKNMFRQQRDSYLINNDRNTFSADNKYNTQIEKNCEESEQFKNNFAEYKIKSELYELEREKRDLDQRLKVRLDYL